MSIKPISTADAVTDKIIKIVKNNSKLNYYSDCFLPIKSLLEEEYEKEIKYYQARLKQIRKYASDKNNEELTTFINYSDEECKKTYLNG